MSKENPELVPAFKKYNGTLFHIKNGCYCGVLVKESTMRRIEKINRKYMDEIKTILTDEKDRGNVFPYMWTLAYPNGKQTNVFYIDESSNVEDRIKSALANIQPEPLKLVFIANSMNDAKQQAEAYYKSREVSP